MRKALIMLAELNDGDIDWLGRVGRRERIEPGRLLIEEGTPIRSLFIVLEGRAVVRVKDVEVARLSSGELLGEISLVDQRPPSASVEAIDEMSVLTIDRLMLKKKLADDVGFGCRFYHAVAIFLADRLRSSTTRLGYGSANAMAHDADLEDELDVEILDKVHLAGAKFDKLLKHTLKAHR